MERKRGRPKTQSPVRERPQLATRVRPELVAYLEKSAHENQHSVGAEVEARLERSFLIEQAFRSHYPTLMAIAFMWGGQQTAIFEKHPEWVPTGEWQTDPACYTTAVFEAVKELWHQHPNLDGVRWEWQEWCGRLASYLGGWCNPGEVGRADLINIPASVPDFEAGRRDREQRDASQSGRERRT